MIAAIYACQATRQSGATLGRPEEDMLRPRIPTPTRTRNPGVTRVVARNKVAMSHHRVGR